MARTMTLERASTSMFSTKLLSILILSNGKDCSVDSDEKPVPKSSMAMRTPSPFSAQRLSSARL